MPLAEENEEGQHSLVSTGLLRRWARRAGDKRVWPGWVPLHSRFAG